METKRLISVVVLPETKRWFKSESPQKFSMDYYRNLTPLPPFFRGERLSKDKASVNLYSQFTVEDYKELQEIAVRLGAMNGKRANLSELFDWACYRDEYCEVCEVCEGTGIVKCPDCNGIGCKECDNSGSVACHHDEW